MTSESKDLVKVESVKGVDITPVITEMVEYSKDQASVGDLESIISGVPRKDSMDWKLISGVLCNSIVEWASNNRGNGGKELLYHIQSDIGYLMKRLGWIEKKRVLMHQ